MLFTSCASVTQWFSHAEDEQYLQSKKSRPDTHDFTSHLAHLGLDFIRSKGIEVIFLSPENRRYFTEMVKRIVDNNRLVYTDNLEFKFYIIKSSTPFYFSLPGGNYFYSTGIFKKYIKSEALLWAIISIQTFRIFNNIYEKKIIIPTGHLGLEEMVGLTRIPLKYRNEVNKWGHLTLMRSGIDPSTILSWIQMRNKNILDFTLMDGQLGVATREEFAFKHFLATVAKNELQVDSQNNSSRGFYKLVQNILDKDP